MKGEEVDAWYSGKHRRPGGNVQAIMRPDGLPLWTSEAEPGHVHDITARLHVLEVARLFFTLPASRAFAGGRSRPACTAPDGTAH